MKKTMAVGTAIFLVGSLFGVGATFAAQMSFSDVSPSDWFYNDVQKMVDWDVIRGNPDGTFKPGNNVNRAELSAMWNRYNAYVAKNYYTKAQIDTMLKNPTTTTSNGNTNVNTTETSKTISLNSAGTLNGVTLTVSSVADYSSSLFKADAGKKYVIADVRISNNSGKTISYNAYNFTLYDKDSYAYQMAVTDKTPLLSSGELENTRETRGYVAFEVPIDATLKDLKYEIDYGKLGQFYVNL
ncbi:MAG: DUF4352 domain-containing protein [Candidatus Gracilibacteria bacterium]